MTDPTPMVEWRGVDKWYGPLHVLNDVTLAVAPGERVVLCGPSGSGKTTAVLCVNGLEPYQRGEVRVDGALVSEAAGTDVLARRHVGMVFQQFNLFPHMSVLQNCVLPQALVKRTPRAEAAERAMYYLGRVHIADQAEKMPAQLSGGQQQRVAIARALCMEPKLMLFDEPTSALDPEMVGEVLDVMIELAGTGMTMVCVTHEMGFARAVAHRIVMMDEGRVIQDSAPDEFFANPASDRVRAFLDQILRV